MFNVTLIQLQITINLIIILYSALAFGMLILLFIVRNCQLNDKQLSNLLLLLIIIILIKRHFQCVKSV